MPSGLPKLRLQSSLLLQTDESDFANSDARARIKRSERRDGANASLIELLDLGTPYVGDQTQVIVFFQAPRAIALVLAETAMLHRIGIRRLASSGSIDEGSTDRTVVGVEVTVAQPVVLARTE